LACRSPTCHAHMFLAGNDGTCCLLSAVCCLRPACRQNEGLWINHRACGAYTGGVAGCVLIIFGYCLVLRIHIRSLIAYRRYNATQYDALLVTRRLGDLPLALRYLCHSKQFVATFPVPSWRRPHAFHSRHFVRDTAS